MCCNWVTTLLECWTRVALFSALCPQLLCVSIGLTVRLSLSSLKLINIAKVVCFRCFDGSVGFGCEANAELNNRLVNSFEVHSIDCNHTNHSNHWRSDRSDWSAELICSLRWSARQLIDVQNSVLAALHCFSLTPCWVLVESSLTHSSH